MKYADLKKEDERVRILIRMLQNSSKSQKAFCSEIGMTIPTFCRRMLEPGTLSLNELRRIKMIANKFKLNFDPLEGIK